MRRRLGRPALLVRLLAAVPVATLAAVALTLTATPAAAQDTVQAQIRASQARLQEIREERARLQREMQSLQGRARDISQELSNIERQVSASAEAVSELDYQTAALAASAEEITQQLVRTRDRLRERTVVLAQRLRDIYQQGPLHSVRVLLGSESFGDLLNRYKYLHLISVHDRMLTREISALEQDLAVQEQELRRNLAQIERLRTQKLSEFARLQQLEQTRARTLRAVRGQVSVAEGRIQQLAEDERRLTDVVERLERERMEAERRRIAAGASAGAARLSPRNLGELRWPVAGELLYRFGPERRPNGVTLRRNGIGIAAPRGSPVHAVAEGTVVLARPMEGFGPGVVLSHGGGYYTLYLYLDDIGVQVGQDVPAGQVIGTVGSSPEDGAHLFFRLHAPLDGGSPVPVDPLPWLIDR